MNEFTRFLCRLRSGCHADLTQLAARQESAIEQVEAGSQIVLSKLRLIRRAAFQKLCPTPILMKTQWNFDRGAGFCPSLLSARFRIAPIRSHTANLVSGLPETPEE